MSKKTWCGAENGQSKTQPSATGTRTDLDMKHQQCLVADSRRLSRFEQGEAELAQPENSIVFRSANDALQYRRHALRVLVLTAAAHQKEHPTSPSSDSQPPHHEQSPRPNGLPRSNRPPTKTFQLQEGQNLTKLLSDIDIFVDFAAGNPEKSAAIMNHVVGQMGSLCLWSS